MLNRIFPTTINNDYQGSLLAKYAFVLLTLITIVRSLIHMFVSDGGAQSIASIPLDTFSLAASDVVILIFALWGLSQLLIGIVYVVVLWRYQKLIPFMYLLMFLEYSLRFLLSHLKPIVTAKVAPGAIGNQWMWLLAAVLLVLSLRQSKQAR